MILSLIFFLFAGLLLLASLLVIYSKNPVHSVLWLIFAFFNAAGLFVLLGAEYLAMTLVVVYVGAVAVLFLFVIMMLNVRIVENLKRSPKTLPLAIFILLVFAAEIFLIYNISEQDLVVAEPQFHNEQEHSPEKLSLDNSNVNLIGYYLFTDYILHFLMCGMVLLVAMIGAIVLSLRKRKGVRKQDIVTQNIRDKDDCVELVDIKL